MSDESRPPKRRRRRRRDGGRGSGESGDKSRRRRRKGGSADSRPAGSGEGPDQGRAAAAKPKRTRRGESSRDVTGRDSREGAPERQSLWRNFSGVRAETDEGDASPTTSAAAEDDPAPTVLRADLPVEEDDPDPSTAGAEGRFDTGPVADLVGIKFYSAGKIYTYDSGGAHYRQGEEVIVEAERGSRWGVVAWPTRRSSHQRNKLRRVLRRPDDSDLQERERLAGENAGILERAKAVARKHQLPIKVFRCESSAGRTLVYFSSESKVDARPLVRDLSKELGGRVDTRQTGVRDEAKMVGGIGSCGQTLCCTTWLPAFVPVSIKHAKDQNLVLNPTKVSGQCGRLKCCLVYEHATYAEMRKGLPKMGKRVVTSDGEGRVVEVDVLRQRVRVSLNAGAAKVYGAGEVEPMFPSQTGKNQSKNSRPSGKSRKSKPGDPT